VFINALSSTIGLIKKHQEQSPAVKPDVQHAQIQRLQTSIWPEHNRMTKDDPAHVAALQRCSEIEETIKSNIKTLRKELRTVEDSIVEDKPPADKSPDTAVVETAPADNKPAKRKPAHRKPANKEPTDDNFAHDKSPKDVHADMQISSELHTPAKALTYTQAYKAIIFLLVLIVSLIGLDYLTGSTILHSVLRVRLA
jgi:hypothetical protein